MQLPLNVSPVSASFFGLMRQGIHPVLCVACSRLFVLHVVHGTDRDEPCPSMALLCFNSCRQSLNKIEVRYRYSVINVRVSSPAPQEWKPGSTVFAVFLVRPTERFLFDLEVDLSCERSCSLERR